MLTPHCLKIAAISLIALQAGLSSTHAQRRGLEAQVTTGTPPGLIKKVEPSGGLPICDVHTPPWPKSKCWRALPMC